MSGAPVEAVPNGNQANVPAERVSAALSVRDEDTVAQLKELGVELHPVARVGVEASAGEGAVVYAEDELEEVAEWLPARYIREQYKVPPDRVKRMLVRGNSMRGTIDEGQEVRVALWRGEPLHHGWIYVLHGPFGIIIKRLWLRKDHIILHSDNPEEDDEQVSGDEFEEQYRVVAWLLEVIEPL